MKSKLVSVHETYISALNVLDDSEFVLTGGKDGVVKLTHTDGEVIAFPKEHSAVINCIDSVDTSAVSGGNLDLVVLWDVITQKKVKKYRTDPTSIQNNDILDVKMLGPLVVCCGTNCHINFLDTRLPNLKPIWRIKEATDAITSVDYHHGKQSLYSASVDGSVCTFDMRNCKVMVDEVAGDNIIHELNLVDENRMILTTLSGLEIRNNDDLSLMVNIATEPTAHKANSVAFKLPSSSTNTLIATGSGNGKVRLWNLDDTKNIKELSSLSILSKKGATKNSPVVSLVQYSNKNNRIYAASWDGDIHYWDDWQ